MKYVRKIINPAENNVLYKETEYYGYSGFLWVTIITYHTKSIRSKVEDPVLVDVPDCSREEC